MEHKVQEVEQEQEQEVGRRIEFQQPRARTDSIVIRIPSAACSADLARARLLWDRCQKM